MASTPGPSSPTVVQYNSAAPIALYTGVRGEIQMDTGKTAIVLHDGSTLGGFTLQASGVTALSAASSSADIISKVNEIIVKLQSAKLMG